MKQTIRFGLVAALAAVSLGPAVAAKRPSSLPGFEIATIQNTGSTNTTGYRIIVPLAGSQVGTAAFNQMTGRISSGDINGGRLPMSLVQRLAHDLHSAMPLNTLPARHGVKSASFGTSLFISYHGQRTPDLTFPSSPKAQALKADAAAIAAVLNLENAPRGPVGPMAPMLPGH